MMNECSRCGNAILGYHNQHHEFVLPVVEDNTFEARDYVFCTECTRQIVDWVEECQEDEVRVDMVKLESAIREFESLSDEFQGHADDLRDLMR